MSFYRQFVCQSNVGSSSANDQRRRRLVHKLTSFVRSRLTFSMTTKQTYVREIGRRSAQQSALTVGSTTRQTYARPNVRQSSKLHLQKNILQNEMRL